MSGTRVSIENMASAIAEILDDYADVTAEGMKKAVKDAGNTVRDEIKSNAPMKSGKYAKSWSVKTMKENSRTMEVVVHSTNRYQLAHLLEFGHALRGGGRARAIPHIASAEQKGIEQLERDIERSLRNG